MVHVFFFFFFFFFLHPGRVRVLYTPPTHNREPYDTHY